MQFASSLARVNFQERFATHLKIPFFPQDIVLPHSLMMKMYEIILKWNNTVYTISLLHKHRVNSVYKNSHMSFVHINMILFNNEKHENLKMPYILF